MVEPRVLVVSHNVFSSSGNMGKTMMHMLAGIPPDNLAQLYFHQEIPTRRCCLHYFRMTDSNILHSLFTRKTEFRVFDASDIDESAVAAGIHGEARIEGGIVGGSHHQPGGIQPRNVEVATQALDAAIRERGG